MILALYSLAVIAFGALLFRISADNCRRERERIRQELDDDILDGECDPDEDFMRRFPDFPGHFIDIRQPTIRTDWRDYVQWKAVVARP